jgi:hypothetical protein
LAKPSSTAAGLAAAALHLRDPHVDGSWGFCPLLATTGLYCPGCGGLRAVHDLTDLDLVAAASSNLLLVAVLPLVLLVWSRWMGRAWLGRAWVGGAWLGRAWVGGAWAGRARVGRPQAVALTSTPVLLAGLAVVLGFGVLRNLPPGVWLAP